MNPASAKGQRQKFAAKIETFLDDTTVELVSADARIADNEGAQCFWEFSQGIFRSKR